MQLNTSSRYKPQSLNALCAWYTVTFLERRIRSKEEFHYTHSALPMAVFVVENGSTSGYVCVCVAVCVEMDEMRSKEPM